MVLPHFFYWYFCDFHKYGFFFVVYTRRNPVELFFFVSQVGFISIGFSMGFKPEETDSIFWTGVFSILIGLGS